MTTSRPTKTKTDDVTDETEAAFVESDEAIVGPLTTAAFLTPSERSALKRILAIARRATEPQSTDGWFPIETAPNLTRILVFLGSGEITVLMWDRVYRSWMDDYADEYSGERSPTHWRPLPTRPGAAPSLNSVVTDEMVEAAAKAIANAYRMHRSKTVLPWDSHGEMGRIAYRFEARAALPIV